MQPSNIRSYLVIGVIWAFLGQALSVTFGIASASLLARLVSSTDLGTFFLASSFIILFAATFQLGLGKAATRLIAKALAEQQLSEAWIVARTTFFVTLVSVTSGALVFYFIGFDYVALKILGSSNLSSMKWLVLTWGAVFALRTVLLDIYRGFHDIRSATLFGEPFTKLIFTMGLAAVWVTDFDADTNLALLIISASVLASTILSIIILMIRGRRFYNFSLVPVKPILVISLPLMIANLGTMIYSQASIWMVGSFESEQEVALFGAALRLSILVSAPLMIILAVIPPMISNLHASQSINRLKILLQTSATIAAIPAAIFLLLFVFFGKDILSLVYGSYYQQAYPLLVVLGIGQFISVFGSPSSLALSMTSHQNVLMYITFVSVTLLLGGGIFAGPMYGTMGIAIINVCVITIVTVAFLFSCRIKNSVWAHPSMSCLSVKELAAVRDLLLQRFQK